MYPCRYSEAYASTTSLIPVNDGESHARNEKRVCPPQPAPAAVPQDIEWRLPRHARSVSRARTLLREQATSWKLPDELTETAALLLSELMTNAYRHAKVSARAFVAARRVTR